MLGFKSFTSATVTLAGVELMYMLQQGQLRTTGECAWREWKKGVRLGRRLQDSEFDHNYRP
jgi:hypothetical protein